jgi:hypothetical protein
MDDDKERCIKIKFGLVKNLRAEVPDDTEVLVYEDGMIFVIDGPVLGSMKDWDAESPDPKNLRKLAEQHGLGIVIDDDESPVGDDDDEEGNDEDDDEEEKEPWAEESEEDE